jgi:hypothetical protein
VSSFTKQTVEQASHCSSDIEPAECCHCDGAPLLVEKEEALEVTVEVTMAVVATPMFAP